MADKERKGPVERVDSALRRLWALKGSSALFAHCIIDNSPQTVPSLSIDVPYAGLEGYDEDGIGKFAAFCDENGKFCISTFSIFAPVQNMSLLILYLHRSQPGFEDEEETFQEEFDESPDQCSFSV